MPHPSTPIPRWHLHIGFAALGLTLIVPFVNPHHFNPIASFYPEWSAVALSLVALTLLLRRGILEQLAIPKIAVLPLGLGALVLIQWACGRITFPGQALIFLLYLLWSVFMLTLGQTLRQAVGISGVAMRLSAALLCGGLLATALLVVQLSGSPLGAGLVFPRASGGIGNLAQPNHLANYLWLGIASAIYLHVQGKLGIAALTVCTLALLAAANLTGSRSVFLYAAGLALLSLWCARRDRQPALTRIARISLLLLPLSLALHGLFKLLDLDSLVGATTSADRFFQLVSGASPRLQLWRTGLSIFADHPWLGAGLGQFPWNSYVLVGMQADGTYIGGGEHAHNLLIHLLAEFGIIAPLLLLMVGWRWWVGFVRPTWSPAHWWIAAVLLIEAAHSNLEYPLWYTFFLGIAALVLGAANDPASATFRPRISRVARPAIVSMLLLGGVTLATLGRDYARLEHALNPTRQQRDDPGYWPATLKTLGQLHRESLLSPYVELVYAYGLSIDREALKDKIVVCERALRFSPVEPVAFKYAYLLALDGRLDDARFALRRALGTHPLARTGAIAELNALTETYPELKPLHELLEETARHPSKPPSQP